MDKKICICVIGAAHMTDVAVISKILAFGKDNNLPEIHIISADEFKKSEFNRHREQIKMHTELILRSIQEIEPKKVIEQYPEEIKYKKEQDKYRERNYKPNFKYGKYGR
jgi:hypothetical protein